MRQLLVRQYRIGPLLGALKMQSARAMFYLALPQLPVGIIAATPQLQKWFPGLSFWWLAGGAVAYFVIVGMWLDYKIMVPSEMAYNNKQSYMHDNPYVRDMAQAQKDIAEIKARLGPIEDKLGVEK